MKIFTFKPVARVLGLIGAVLLILAGLYGLMSYSYLLFHTSAELFSVVIAVCAFIIVWNSKQHIKNNFFVMLGITCLAAGILDLLHTLAYEGMEIFVEYGTDLATQLWIAARYLASLGLVAATLFIFRRIKAALVLFITLAVAGTLVILIFTRIFPECFEENVGLTPFKIVSEYLICVYLAIAVFRLYLRKKKFQKMVFRLIVGSALLTIASEISFTLYSDPYGMLNFCGHFLKIISFYLIYEAIIKKAIREPYDLIFKELRDKETALEQETMHDNLTGAYNRKAAYDFISKNMELARRIKKPLTICLLDVDKFKHINDTFGHLEGDNMLKLLVRTISESVRGADYVCRIGGDEFLIIFPDLNELEAHKLIQRVKERVRQNVAALRIRHQMDFSFGFASVVDGREETVNALLVKADEAMYRDKAAKQAAI